MKKQHYILIVILVLFFLLFRFVGEIGQDTVTAFKVIRIIDGDTVELAGRGVVRLLGIDTPEEGELFYDSAVAYLANLILGEEVSLEFGFRKRDRYNRLLAYLYLDSVLVNAAIIENGWGNLYLFPENMQDKEALAQLFAAQHKAMRDNSGIWRVPPVSIEEYYIGNSRSFRFHRPACPSVEKLKDENRIIFYSRDEAFHEGYSPCRNCRP